MPPSPRPLTEEIRRASYWMQLISTTPRCRSSRPMSYTRKRSLSPRRRLTETPVETVSGTFPDCGGAVLRPCHNRFSCRTVEASRYWNVYVRYVGGACRDRICGSGRCPDGFLYKCGAPRGRVSGRCTGHSARVAWHGSGRVARRLPSDGRLRRKLASSIGVRGV